MRTRTQQAYIFLRYGFWYVRYYDNVIRDGASQRKQLCERLAPRNEEYPNKRSVKSLAAKFLDPINAGEVDRQSTMQLADFINMVYLPEVKESLRRREGVEGCRREGEDIRGGVSVSFDP